jgi:hypothetical protein
VQVAFSLSDLIYEFIARSDFATNNRRYLCDRKLTVRISRSSFG